MATPHSFFVRSNIKHISHYTWSACYYCKNSLVQHRTLRGHHGQSTSRPHPFGVRYTSSMLDLRFCLRNALSDLQKNASGYVNQSRLQLALRGLEQKAGDETIRIAIMIIKSRKSSLNRAKELLRLLNADPLKSEEEWEQALLAEGSQSILLKIANNDSPRTFKEGPLVRELQVSSPVLNGQNIEFLVLESESLAQEPSEENLVEEFLVPKMKIPNSSTGRYTIVSTPVHKTLLVIQGLCEATSVLKYPIKSIDPSVFALAIDMDVAIPGDRKTPSLSQFVNVCLASHALKSFRESSSNSLSYEKSWFASGLPNVLNWLQEGTKPTNSSMKLPLVKLIKSLLWDASRAVEKEQALKHDIIFSKRASETDILRLQKELKNWAYRAHTELRDHLDTGFWDLNWHKLSWWELFWRVDDVSVIASDILNQKFLNNAEKEAIFLAGRIKERDISDMPCSTATESWARKLVQNEPHKRRIWDGPQPPQHADFISFLEYPSQLALKCKPWPQEISMTRLHLLQHTVSVLQSLAQTLVDQTLSISSVTTVLSILIYTSSESLGFYETGTVAAVGIVFSLRRMQKKWEDARRSWEIEVREEGIKALRSTEKTFKTHFKKELSIQEDDEVRSAKAAIKAAEDALVAYKQIMGLKV